MSIPPPLVANSTLLLKSIVEILKGVSTSNCIKTFAPERKSEKKILVPAGLNLTSDGDFTILVKLTVLNKVGLTSANKFDDNKNKITKIFTTNFFMVFILFFFD